MKYLIAILLLFVSIGAFASKQDSVVLMQSVTDLNNALISKDSLRLKILLKDNLHYYHSNGWLQLKRDVIDDLFNGKLTYKKLTATSPTVRFTGNIAQVRTFVDVEVELNGKPVQLKLRVVQVWVKNERWELYSRHSEKIVI